MSSRTLLSSAIFKGEQHYKTSSFGDKRSGGRIHQGTDYGTGGNKVAIYCPFDNAKVVKVVPTEIPGNERGCYIELQWEIVNLGMIFQHLEILSIPFEVGQIISAGEEIGITDMTGRYSNGTLVSTGIHLHVESYNIDSKSRFDFESLDYNWIYTETSKDFRKEDELTEKEVRKIIEEYLHPSKTEPWPDLKTDWDKAVKFSITTGERPQDLATRQEVVAIAMNTINAYDYLQTLTNEQKIKSE